MYVQHNNTVIFLSDDACKSKDYITPPTSPLPLRANRTAKSSSESVPTTFTASLATSATPLPVPSSTSEAGLVPVVSQRSSVSPSAASSTSDISSSSGAYETIAKPTPAAEHAAGHPTDKPHDKPDEARNESPTSTEHVTGVIEQLTRSKQASSYQQAQPHDEPQSQVSASSPASSKPAEQPPPALAGQEGQPQSQPRPAAAVVTPAVSSVALSDRESFDDYEPAVYSDLLVTRSVSPPTATQPDPTSDTVRTGGQGSSSGSPPAAEVRQDPAPAAPSSQVKGATTALPGIASAGKQPDSSSALRKPEKAVKVSGATSTPLPASSALKVASKEAPASSVARSSQYSIVKKPRPVSSFEVSPRTLGATNPQNDVTPDTAKSVPTRPAENAATPGAAGLTSTTAAVSTAQSETSPLATTTNNAAPALRTEGATPLPDSSSAESQERRSSDSSTSTSSSSEVTEKEQLTRPGPPGWVTSNIYASPSKGAPRTAPDQATDTTTSGDSSPSTASAGTTETDNKTADATNSKTTETMPSAPESGTASNSVPATSAPSGKTNLPSTDAAYEANTRATSPSTVVDASTRAGGGFSPSTSVSPTPGPVTASSRHDLSPSERLELAKRVICNHVQRQRPSPGAATSAGTGSTGAEASAGAIASPQQPPVHHGPSGPYIPATTTEIPDIDEGADSGDLAHGAVDRPRTLQHVITDVTPASDSSGEENAAAATAGNHVVFTSSDSLSEGYEAVVSVRFQPGDGRGGGVTSSTRSPMPVPQLVTSSSAESLSRSDHQAAPRSGHQAALRSGLQVASRSESTTAAEGGVEASSAAGDDTQGAIGAARGSGQTKADLADSSTSREDPAAGSTPQKSSNSETSGGLEGSGSPDDQSESSSSAPKVDDSATGQAAGQTSEASPDSESSDSDGGSAAVARPSDLDVEALKEGLKHGRTPELRRSSAERQKVQVRHS